MTGVLIGIFTAVHIVVALFLIVLVLMQKSSEQGVGAAFGGGMTETVFGAGTTTALVRLTIWCACSLLATTLILAVLHSHHTKPGGSLMRQSLTTMPLAPATQPVSPLTLPPSTPASTEPVSATPSTPAQNSQPATAPAPSTDTSKAP
jgi:preprotein translocase subunit SecG